MVYAPMEMLKNFHDKFDIHGVDRNQDIEWQPLIDKRDALITEEFLEVTEALSELHADLENPEMWHHVAKELADLLYVTYGTAEELGIPLQEIFEEVHRSNMSKVWEDGSIHRRMDGKVLKPPTYSEADIKRVFNEYYP